jgi:hypothetical protein
MMENIRLLGEPIRLLIHKRDEAMKRSQPHQEIAFLVYFDLKVA